jgi:hypothetical protein
VLDAGSRPGTPRRYQNATQAVTVANSDLTVDTVQLDDAKSSTSGSQ